MKNRLCITTLATLMLTCSGCFVTNGAVYYDDRALDLGAVGAVFAQSSSVREFEMLLNDYSLGISNLDLDRDGYVDYLRVVETIQGGAHLLHIQAVLGYNYYENVATVIVENPLGSNWYVEIVGAPSLYGQSCYVRPVYYSRPLILSHFRTPHYTVWESPWYWGYYPTRYRRHAPIHVDNYRTCVHSYMHSHSYCHNVRYVSAPRSTHADKSFSHSTALPAQRSTSAVRRASSPSVTGMPSGQPATRTSAPSNRSSQSTTKPASQSSRSTARPASQSSRSTARPSGSGSRSSSSSNNNNNNNNSKTPSRR